MAYTVDKKTGEITIAGWEKGIATSPHNGIANLQAVNIATESGEVMCNLTRIQQTQQNSTAVGTLTPSNTSHLDVSISGINIFTAGIWVTVGGGITGLSAGNYFVASSAGAVNTGIANITLSSTYLGSPVTFTASGTATVTIITNIGQPIAQATEKYSDGSAFQYRYYVLDKNGLLWVNDTALPITGAIWFCPDSNALPSGDINSGLTVLNGWVLGFGGTTISAKSTSVLGATPGWVSLAAGSMLSGSPNPHFAFTGHQGKTYYTDGGFIGSIFPNTSLLTGAANIQSYSSYTAATTTGTITTVLGGSIPYNGTSNTVRIPAVFFATTGGTKPAAITVGTIYYIKWLNSSQTFEVYAAASGGSSIDMATGAVGVQYFNTFYPASSGGSATLTFTPERLNLPFFETSTSIAELGDLVIIGTKSNILYPWNQVDPLPGDLIPLPENGTSSMITVNNMVYVFAGNKGNVYITNGSTASLVLSVPDYCAGIAGTESSYIEPYFTWGGAMYLRGRVWFSILDQTATKAGNCGGIWSFVPTQNFFIGQDTGLSLRMENQASYGTYSGVSTLLIPSQNQLAISPQYWNAWYSSISSATFGIDFTNSTTSVSAVIETDLIPVGTLLDKRTFSQIEYKLSAPLVAGENVTINYRTNSTDAYATAGIVVTDSSSATSLSGYIPPVFEKVQWLQLQIKLNPNTSSSGSFVRLKEIYVR